VGTEGTFVGSARALDHVATRVAALKGTVPRLARALINRCREVTPPEINALTTEITSLVSTMAPSLIAIPGCGAITAAKILGERAGVDRFRSQDAYARHNGTAPMPVWSSNKARHRLSAPATATSTPRRTGSL
jgi:transposase